jgi:hypothetical protein
MTGVADLQRGQRNPTPLDGQLALVASATRFPGSITRIHQAPANWQGEAWRHFDICGELRYAAQYVGNILGRATLHAAQVTTKGLIAEPASHASQVLLSLFAGKDGQEQMLHAFGVHLTIAGECYLVGRTESGEDIWEVVGTQEISRRGDQWYLDYGDGQGKQPLEDSAVVIRVWRPHPRKRIEADSPVRALLPILTEIEYLTRHIFAQVQSRLAGAGILQLPQGLTFPPVPGMPETANSAESFMAVLGQAMIKPIEDPGNPAALVPIVITVPDELVGKMEHLTFWSDLDQHAVELRTEAIRRLALGLEMPPEILLGTSDMNHWSGWLVEESAVKAHIEPLLGLITNAITVGYLRPQMDDDISWVVASDTSQLRLRPNRSQEAIELYDRGELDGEALRRETGFTEDDKPNSDEYKLWLLRKVASGSTTPEQVAAALNELGVALPVGAGDTQEARPVPSLEDHPSNDIPETLYAAAEVLVFRALERAGNKMRSVYGVRPPGVNAADMYRYVPVRNGDLDRFMEDAWSCLPQTMQRFTCDQTRIKGALDSYTRSLIMSQSEHSYEAMCRFLKVPA